MCWCAVWQPRHATDMQTNWWQSLFCCCTATDGAEAAVIDVLVSSWSENISASFYLRAPGYGLTLWCAVGLLVGGAIPVSQLQLQLRNHSLTHSHDWTILLSSNAKSWCLSVSGHAVHMDGKADTNQVLFKPIPRIEGQPPASPLPPPSGNCTPSG